MKKIRIAAAGDNCMDVYDKENKAFPGGNPVNVEFMWHVLAVHPPISDRWVQMSMVSR